MALGTELISESESTDFFFEVSRGRVKNHEAVIIDSRLPVLNIVDGSLDVWSGGGDLVPLVSAELMEVVSTDAADLRDTGTGQRTSLLSGIDGNYNRISEVIELTGVTPVVTALEYLRVFSIEQIDVGSGAVNAGDISVTSQGSSTLQCHCESGRGRSENSHYTVPAGKALQVIQIDPNVTRTVGGGNVCSLVRGESILRSTATDFGFVRIVEFQVDTGLGNFPSLGIPLNTPIPERTDIRFQANTDKDATEVRLRWCGVLCRPGIR